MASFSGLHRVCSSGLRPSCHGENCDEIVDTRKLGMQLPDRIARQVPSQCIASCSPSADSESNHSYGVGAHAPQCGRREMGMASLAFCLFTLSNSNKGEEAMAGGLDKYLKKKKLDPLDTYVPIVLLAQSQFQEVDGKLEAGEQKMYADARSLLRTGPAASLRNDIRAVAQYATETGNEDGSLAVDQCLSALEDLDSLLFQASRSNGAPVERMKKDLIMTVSALDRLLATVPAEILERSKAIADAYKEASY
ncbi:unnamed protein product [Calypogeia fissa]